MKSSHSANIERWHEREKSLLRAHDEANTAIKRAKKEKKADDARKAKELELKIAMARVRVAEAEAALQSFNDGYHIAGTSQSEEDRDDLRAMSVDLQSDRDAANAALLKLEMEKLFGELQTVHTLWFEVPVPNIDLLEEANAFASRYEGKEMKIIIKIYHNNIAMPDKEVALTFPRIKSTLKAVRSQLKSEVGLDFVAITSPKLLVSCSSKRVNIFYYYNK